MNTAHFPKALGNAEQELIRQRRANVGDDPTRSPECDAPVVGLALSGGGIRSATFCLGVLQALAKKHVLPKIDYLSTISGGGYIGSFLGMLFINKKEMLSGTASKTPMKAVTEVLASPTSDEVRFLRENGRYLSPNGGGGGLIIAAVYLRNLIGVHAVMGSFLLFAFLTLNMLRFGGFTSKVPDVLEGFESSFLSEAGETLWWSPWFVLPLLSLVLWFIPACWAYWNTQFAARMKSIGRGLPALLASLLVVAAGVLMCLRPDSLEAFAVWLKSNQDATANGQVLTNPRHVAFFGGFLVIAGAMMAIMWWIASVFARLRNRPQPGIAPAALSRARTADVRNVLSSWLRAGLGVTVICMAVALIDTFGQTLYALTRADDDQPALKLFLAATGLAGVLATIYKYKGIFSLLGRSGEKSKMQVPLRAVAGAAGFLVLFLSLVFWSWAAHAITYAGGEPAGGKPGAALLKAAFPKDPTVEVNADRLIKVNPVCPDEKTESTLAASAKAGGDMLAELKVNRATLIASWILIMLLSWCAGLSVDFLNMSALQTFYGARLARAYLGAANASRRHPDVTRTDSADDKRFATYHPESAGGPLHLIGVTLNETVSGRSQVVDKDRKGMVFGLGPAGLCCGISDHALWDLETPASDTTRVRISPLEKDGDGYHMLKADAEAWKKKPEVEALNVGNWVSISGAAFSTGMGANTSTGISLLLAAVNIRLGYFWDSQIKPWWRNARVTKSKIADSKSRDTDMKEKVRRAGETIGDFLARGLWERLITYCPVHSHLLYESLALFHGPNRKLWYLSDGGHFENTGCYELIRRRVPFIICCDCGADPAYLMEDMSNLVRKARIDFQAHVEFFTPNEIRTIVPQELRGVIGTVTDLQRSATAVKDDQVADATRIDGRLYSKAHATLAWVTYEDDDNDEGGEAAGTEKKRPPASCILFIKPTLTGDEPLDLKNYHALNETFPQQTTLDQFFDEAQWESYRRLGEHIGDKLFATIADGPWAPDRCRAPERNPATKPKTAAA